MKLNKQEAENIMNMLTSPDQENGYLAFKAIDAHDYETDDVGYLLYFYKFSRYVLSDWKEYAPKAYKLLDNLLEKHNLKDAPVTYSRALSIMVCYDSSKDSIELFLERHVKDLSKSLKALGYPIDKLGFTLKLKE